MIKPLDELYLEWLYYQAAPPENPPAEYWKLYKQLYETEFTWSVNNDENRAMDGIELRVEFADDLDIQIQNERWLERGCSFLEMLVALSRRLSFMMDMPSRVWFWILLENLKLERYSDTSRWRPQSVDVMLYDVIHRRFSPDGERGLFPLKHPKEDQREVEIWYQMSAYINERLGL